MVGQSDTMGAPTAQDQTHRASLDHDLDHDLDNDRDNDRDDDLDDDLEDAKPKKKRRVVKTGDKKYECPEPDCGKSYSRAEHLYRHQLNRPSSPPLSFRLHSALTAISRHSQADLSLRFPLL